MKTQEMYIADQKASGIAVGDTVRATRHFDGVEGGHTAGASHSWAYKAMFIDAGAIGTVTRVENSYIEVQCGINFGGFWNFPYFVLEIVKKADGSVPELTITGKTEITGDSTMKNRVFDCEVVAELTDKNGKVDNKTIVKRYSFFATDATDARETVLMDHGETIKAHRKVSEVEIICRPFCG